MAANSAGGTAQQQQQDGAVWESFSIEGAFTLDEEEGLLAPSAGAAGGAQPAFFLRQQLHKTVSRFTLQSEEERDSWKTYVHEARR